MDSWMPASALMFIFTIHQTKPPTNLPRIHQHISRNGEHQWVCTSTKMPKNITILKMASKYCQKRLLINARRSKISSSPSLSLWACGLPPLPPAISSRELLVPATPPSPTRRLPPRSPRHLPPPTFCTEPTTARVPPAGAASPGAVKLHWVPWAPRRGSP